MKKTTIISVMAVLWPKTNKDKGARSKDQLPMRNAVVICYPAVKVSVMLLLIFGLFIPTVWAQDSPVKPLMVGDKVPESFWQQEHAIYQDGKTTTQTLATYKGKLLILDFWATWCTSCFKKMSFLNSAVEKGNPKLAVMLINAATTKDDLIKIKQRFELIKPELGDFTLPTIYNDDFLTALFPHVAVPYYVWINESGYVTAFTGSALINQQNIDLLLPK